MYHINGVKSIPEDKKSGGIFPTAYKKHQIYAFSLSV
jgi:hypothetical protein